MGMLLFWQWNPPDPEMAVTLWRTFLDIMAGWLVPCVLVCVVVTAACYSAHARSKRIRQSGDVFASYTPIVWLVLAVAPAAILFVAYWIEFERVFPAARVSWVGGATMLAVVGGLATLILSYWAMWLPLITPRKFRYRPRTLLMKRSLTRKDATEQA